MNKCDEAKAWDQWMYANPERLDPISLKATARSGQYLENRLAAAFQDGITVGKKIALDRIHAKLTRVVQ